MKNNRLKLGKSVFTMWVLFLFLFMPVSYGSDSNAAPAVSGFRVVQGESSPTYNGDVSLSFPLLEVPGTGISLPITLSYQAGISTHQAASSVGLGFNLGVGSVVRGVNNYIDDMEEQGEMGKSVANYGCVHPDGYNAVCGPYNGQCSFGVLTPCLGGCIEGQFGGCSVDSAKACVNRNTGVVDSCVASDTCNANQVYTSCTGLCQAGVVGGCTSEPTLVNSVEGSLHALLAKGVKGTDDEGGNQDFYFLNSPAGATKMMFNEAGEFIPLSWSNIDIDYSTSSKKGSKNALDSFSVVDESGTKYLFGGSGATDSVEVIGSSWTTIKVDNENNDEVYSDEEIAAADPHEVCNDNGLCASNFIGGYSDTGSLWRSYDYYIDQGYSANSACESAWICPYEYSDNFCGDSFTQKLHEDYLYNPNEAFPDSIKSGSLTSPSYQMKVYRCKDSACDSGFEGYNELNGHIDIVAEDSRGCSALTQIASTGYGNTAKFAAYRQVDIGAEYIDTWYLTEAHSVDYVDSDGISGASDGDDGSWVKVDYGVYVSNFVDETPEYNAQEIASPRLVPINHPSDSSWFAYDISMEVGGANQGSGSKFLSSSYEDVMAVSKAHRKSERDLMHIESIETATHRANFVYSAPTKGSRDMVEQLDTITLIYKETGMTLLSYDFAYRVNDKLKDPGNLGFGQRTLTSVTKNGYAKASEPPLTFDYNECNPSFDTELYDNKGQYREFTDSWGFYSENTDDNGNYVVDDMSDGCGANSWSLSGVTYPTGGSIDYTYEPNSYKYIQDYTTYGVAKIGGGIRVSTTTVADGIDPIPLTTKFEYGNGVATREPAEAYNFAAREWSNSIAWDYPGAGSGVYIGYETITSKAPEDGSYGYTVYDFKDPKELSDDDWSDCAGHNVDRYDPCVGGYLTDNSWQRNYPESVTLYSASGVPVQTVINEMDTSTVKFEWEQTNDFVDPRTGQQPSTDYNPHNVVVDYDVKSVFPFTNMTSTTIDGVTNQVEYEYNDKGLLYKTIEHSDYGDKVTVVEYAYESNPGMAAKNMLNQVKETKIYEGSDSGTPLLVSRTEWSDSWSGDANGKWYPSAVSVGTLGDMLTTSTILEYDKFGRVIKSKDGKDHITKMYYGTSSDPCCESNGGVCSGENIQLTCAENNIGHKVESYYDDMGRIDYIKDPNNAKIYYYYDGLSRLSDIKKPTDGNSARLHYAYDFALSHGAISPTNANEVMTTQELGGGVQVVSRGVADGLGRNIQTQIEDGDSVILQDIKYNDIAKPESQTKPDRFETNKQSELKKLNPIKRLFARIGLIGKDIGENHYILDKGPRAIIKSEVDYDLNPLARVSKTYPLGKDSKDSSLFIEQVYGSESFGGNDLRTVTFYDEKRHSGMVSTDQFGNTRKTEDEDSTVAVFEYNLLGQMLKSDVDDSNPSNPAGDGIVGINRYDNFGRVNMSCDPDRGCTFYTYDNNGNAETVRDSRGWVTRFDYDGLDRIINIYVNKGSGEVRRLANIYDVGCTPTTTSIGNLCKVSNFDDAGDYISHVDYGYDSSGRVTYFESNFEESSDPISYMYDYADNLLMIASDDYGIIGYNYNHLNQMKSISDYGESIQLAEFDYNPSGTLRNTVYGNDVSTDYEYNDRDWLMNISVGNNLFFEKYEYDDVGNLDKMYDATNASVEFGYDGLYRLEDIIDYGYYDDSSVEFTLDSISYGYDALGNRELRTFDGVVENYNYDYPCDVEEYCHEKRTSRLWKTDGCDYDYDYVGNMIEKSCNTRTTVYTYDYNNLISEISLPDGRFMFFTYDPLGRRIQKQVVAGDESLITNYVYGMGNSPLADIVEGGISDCYADFDGNGIVNLADTIEFVSCYQGDQYYSLCDLSPRYNPDGIVDLSDVVSFAGNLGCEEDVPEIDWVVEEICREICRTSSFEVKELFRDKCNCGKPLDIEVQDVPIPE